MTSGVLDLLLLLVLPKPLPAPLLFLPASFLLLPIPLLFLLAAAFFFPRFLLRIFFQALPGTFRVEFVGNEVSKPSPRQGKDLSGAQGAQGFGGQHREGGSSRCVAVMDTLHSLMDDVLNGCRARDLAHAQYFLVSDGGASQGLRPTPRPARSQRLRDPGAAALLVRQYFQAEAESLPPDNPCAATPTAR